MAIALVNHVKAEIDNDTDITSAPIDTTNSGLFVCICVGQGTVAILDSNSNTWITGLSQNFNGTNGITHFFFVQAPTCGSGNTITGTETGGAGPLLLFAAFSGVALSGGIHANATPTELGGVTAAVVCPAVTTTVAGCLILSILIGSNFPAVVVPTSLHGTVTDGLSTNGLAVSGGMSWFVSGAAGSYSDTLTFAGQTDYDFASYTVAFAPAAGGGAGVSKFKGNNMSGGMSEMSGGMSASDREARRLAKKYFLPPRGFSRSSGGLFVPRS